MIYGIGVREHGHIKIGYTKSNPIARMKDLQVGNPHKLSLFFKMDGNMENEKKIHQYLKKYHMNGEWFELNKIALKEIQENGFISFPIVSKDYSKTDDFKFRVNYGHNLSELEHTYLKDNHPDEFKNWWKKHLYFISLRMERRGMF